MENQFIFTRPLSYELKDNGDLMISLDISTTEPDLVNDIVTLNFLKSMQRQIIDRNVKLDIEHESFRGKSVEEKEINKTKIPAGRMLEPEISEYKNEKNETHHRLNIKGIINKFRTDFENIKGSITDKFLDAGSIAFIPTKFRKETKGSITYRYLDDGIILNTALTGNPINTTAQMRSIISKSLDSLEEYQKSKETDPHVEGLLEVKNHDHLSDVLIKLQEVKKNMGEDKKAEDLEAEKAKTEDDEKKKEEEAKKKKEEESKKEQKSLELKSEVDRLTKENAELKSGLDALKTQVSEMDAAISKPVKKSMPETPKKDFAEKKSYPLDFIA